MHETTIPASNPKRKHSVAKWVVVLGGTILFIVLLGVIWFVKLQASMAGQANFVLPPEAITTQTIALQAWPTTLTAVGSLRPMNGLTLTADLGGTVAAIGFESGTAVKKDIMLIQQDISEENAQLRAAMAAQNVAQLNLGRLKDLLAKRVSSQSDFDEKTALFLQTQARVEEIKAVIEKKTIRAPFDGTVGIRQVNIGQYLRPGDEIVPIQSLRPLFANFSLPQEYLTAVRAGQPVQVKTGGQNEVLAEGKITAVNPVVDEATRNFLVQATIPNDDEMLRPGMFANMEVALPGDREVLAIPSTAISYAPYGDSVFVISEMTDPKTQKSYAGAEQRFVKLGESRGDVVEVLSGLEAGNEVATSGIFKLRPNVAVFVDNRIQPASSLTPEPPDR